MRTTLYLSLVLLLCAATANAKIIFTADEDGISKIYVMDDNGHNIRKISDNPYADWRPVWSPNGRQIVFKREFKRDTTPNNMSTHADIFIMNANGTNARQLSDGETTVGEMRISPDGKKVLYLTAFVGINILDIDTRNTEKILPSTHGYHCDWSPDGKQIVFINDDHDVIEKNLWIVDANGDNLQQFTHPDPEKGKIHRFFPRWSPGGKQMLYSEMDIGDGTFRIIIHNMDDDTTRTLKMPENWNPSSLAWMDGQQSVLFSAYEYERDNRRPVVVKIYKYDLATDGITFLTEGSRPHWNGGELSVSPIGNQSIRWAELKAK